MTLKKTSEYKKVYEGGNFASCPYAVVYAAGNGLGFRRFGFTVSKKVGSAVVRNRVRRRLKEIARDLLVESITEENGRDYVLVAKPAAYDAEFGLLKSTIIKTFYRAYNKTLDKREAFDKNGKPRPSKQRE